MIEALAPDAVLVLDQGCIAERGDLALARRIARTGFARQACGRGDDMNLASADALSARHRLQTGGWIARSAESFRHLPPPPAEVWLGDGPRPAAARPRRRRAPAGPCNRWVHPARSARRRRALRGALARRLRPAPARRAARRPAAAR
jgi:hypothetical protein